MNIEIIDEWLDEEYGVSYTNLEKLHDFYFEKYAGHKEEIKELQDRIEKAIEYIEKNYYETIEDYKGYVIATIGIEELLNILKGENKNEK